MHLAAISILVSFTIISKTQSQSIIPSNSRNPVSYVKNFADGIKQRSWQSQFILDKYGNNRYLLSDLLEKAINITASDCDIALGIFVTDLRQMRKYAIRSGCAVLSSPI